MFAEKLVIPSFVFLLISIFVPEVGGLGMFVFLLSVWATGKFNISFSNIGKNKFFLFQVAFWVWVLASVSWSKNTDKGFAEVGRLSTFLIFPILFAGRGQLFRRYKSQFWLCIWLAGLIISVICIGSVVIRAHGNNLMQLLVYENLAQASQLQPIYLSLFLIIASIAWYAYRWESGFTIWYHWLLPVFFLVMIIMLSSRMELMVALIIWLCIIGKYAFESKKYLQSIILILGIACFTFAGIKANSMNSARFAEMVNLEADYTQNQWGGRSLRIEKWKNTLELYRNYPILGTGIGDYFEELMATYTKNGFTLAADLRFNTHNQYLQTLCALGLIGALLLFGVFWQWFWLAFRSGNWPSILFILAFGLSMITESMLERQTGLFLFGFFGNWLASTHVIEVPNKVSS